MAKSDKDTAADSAGTGTEAPKKLAVGDVIPYAASESGVMTVCAVNEAGTVVDLGYTAAGPVIVRGYVLPV